MSSDSLARAYLLVKAKSLAGNGDVSGMALLCHAYLRENPDDLSAWGEIGNLFLNAGLLSDAERCYRQRLTQDPTDLLALSGIAALELSRGQSHRARLIYDALESLYPQNSVVRRNALMQLEYDPEASDPDRFIKAKNWGEWALKIPFPPRPPTTLLDRPLRVGYISPDFCQHTVGLMVRDVITQHTPGIIEAFAYHLGERKDWVTQLFEEKTRFRDASTLSDPELHDCIVNDGIDILVDLAGHTAGSRLSVFTSRPAPVQVSWLGYFATTGLPVMDAFLLDAASVLPDTQSYFCERIALLTSRFCYSPMPSAPEVSEFPLKKNGFLTFGSFNNTAKLNAQVIQLWAQVLKAHTGSRLVLKWRTLLDVDLQDRLIKAFAAEGVDPTRLDLRGPSTHVNLLADYGDIDIALDPFPFNGGQTTCDALLMGVPVVTLAQKRPVSRQGASILRACGLDNLVATNAQGYIDNIAVLAVEIQQGRLTRASIHQRFLTSPICDAQSFVLDLERTLLGIYRDISESTQANC